MSLDVAVDRDPFAAGEAVAVLPSSFPAWGFDLEAFLRREVSPVPEDLFFQAECPQGPVGVPGEDLVGVVAAVAFLVAGMDLLGLPDRDWTVELGIAEVFHQDALESVKQAPY